MALKLAGVKQGDRVFCSDSTFAATANPIVYEKCDPVFIDSEYDTWNMDPKALEKAFEKYPDTKVPLRRWMRYRLYVINIKLSL